MRGLLPERKGAGDLEVAHTWDGGKEDKKNQRTEQTGSEEETGVRNGIAVKNGTALKH